ncbi:unnamed protein product [Dicrocoelium dendriticum]|nr:unnamed protein product [Dicrocoelium dendriticum]
MSTKRVAAHLTEETLVEYRQAFDALDMNNTGKISTLDVAMLMRKLGLMPSNLEVEELIVEVDKEKNSALEGISFEQFCTMAAWKYNETYTETEIIDAFRTFDLENNGFIPASDLRHALCQMGERLNDDEVDAMIEMAQDEEGNIYYEDFVRKIMADI